MGELLRVVEDGQHTIDAGTHLLTATEALEALRQQLSTGAELSLAADSITRPIDLARAAHARAARYAEGAVEAADAAVAAHVRKAAGVSSAAQAKRMDALLRQDALQRRDAAYTRAWRDLLEDAAARYPGYKVESAAGNGAYLPIGMRADRFSSADVAYMEDTDDDGYTFRTPAQEDATFGWIHGGRAENKDSVWIAAAKRHMIAALGRPPHICARLGEFLEFIASLDAQYDALCYWYFVSHTCCGAWAWKNSFRLFRSGCGPCWCDAGTIADPKHPLHGAALATPDEDAAIQDVHSLELARKRARRERDEEEAEAARKEAAEATREEAAEKQRVEHRREMERRVRAKVDEDLCAL